MPLSKAIAILTVVRYPKWAIPFAIFSMAIFRLPLWLSKKNSFYKLMGSGKNGTFDKTPDWQQWAALLVAPAEMMEDTNKALANSKLAMNNNPSDTISLVPSFLKAYWKLFNCQINTFILEPIEGHGFWDGKQVFGSLPKQTSYDGKIAVLTRATIRLSKLKAFWGNVGSVATQMNGAKGFITSYGIGEIPFIKQATFSIWENKTDLKNFAYKMKEHAEVVRKTHAEKWYSEEMFVRFKVVAVVKSD